MIKKYLWLVVLVLVLGAGTVFLTQSSNFSLPMTNEGVSNPRGMGVADSYKLGTQPSAITEEMMMPTDYYPGMPPYIGGGDALSVQDRQYQTYASYSVITKDVSGYLNRLRDSYLAMEGRVLNLTMNTSGKYQHGYMTAKIPVASFDTASQEAVKGVEKVVDQSMNSVDVTGVSVGLDQQVQQLETQRSQKELELLEAKTDIEKRRIQVEINRLQLQIESVKKQKETQDTQVQYATITVSAASSERVYNPSSRPDLGDTLQEAIDSVLDNLAYVAQIFIWSGVYAAVIAPVIWLVTKLRKQKVVSKPE